MEKNEKTPAFEMPKVEYVPVEPVHTAKSWNPGKGKDKTGTGNSDFGGSQGGGPKKGHDNNGHGSKH